MKKSKFLLVAIVLAFILTGCSTKISDKIPANGVLAYEDVKFPKIDDMWDKNIITPSKESLNSLKTGLSKDEIKGLISYPRFSEGLFGVREWDYVFRFEKEDGSELLCQFKVIFDEDYKAGSYFYDPQDCDSFLNREDKNTGLALANSLQNNENSSFANSADNTPAKTRFIGKNSSSKGGFLSDNAEFDVAKNQVFFDFASSKLSSKEKSKLIKMLARLDREKIKSIQIDGFADRIGSENVNLKLSEKRALSVKRFLKAIDVRSEISTNGFGKRFAATTCDDNISKAELIKCLAQDRHANINISFK